MNELNKELNKAYQPQEIEGQIYDLWEKSGAFTAEINKKKKPFTIVIPPPNITGSLHMGHALNNTIQDILIRYHRMKGEPTLWLPGTDHAGIATQNVVEKELKKERLTRHDLGREKFIEKVWQWKEKYGDLIIEQLKKLGCSCDWSRLRFTMDEKYSQAVKTAFIHYYNKGYIYKGPRLVNWCPRCQTAISDIEIKYEPQKTKLYTFKYNQKFPIAIATTRPETKLGDTAIAVNPQDERYKKYIGQEIPVDFLGVNLKIKIIGDRNVDPEFGTGALGVTPAHSLIDFEMGEENNLEIISVIDQNGKMTERAGDYSGLTVKEAREKIIADLEKQGLLEKTEDYEHSLSLCDRCSTPVEPLISDQWFIKMEKLAKPAIEAVKKNKVKFIPQRYKKIYLDWMDNLRDWCISRQLWWGHQLPVFYCQDCQKMIVDNQNQTEIIYLRHGEALSNELDQINSDVNKRDIKLTAKGRKQIENIIPILKKENVDIIICSDFARTKETAEIIAKNLNLKIIEDKNLREVGVGEFEGKSEKDFTKWRENFSDWHHDSPKGIESYDSLKSRVHLAIEKIIQKYANKKILIVTHGDVVWTSQQFRTNIHDEEIMKLPYIKLGEFIKIKYSSVKCSCGSNNLVQETDVLDTWFSSALWPFATLGWPASPAGGPNNTDDLKYFYPTTFLCTAPEILYLWVARMIFSGLEFMNKIPFDTVYLHSTVLTREGKRMSKSLGTGVDPLNLIEKYGADATRLGIIYQTTRDLQGVRFSEDALLASQKFINKIWNIGRFLLTNNQQLTTDNPKPNTLSDQWIIGRLNGVIKETTDLIEEYEFGKAAHALYEFAWHEFADWYVEISKVEKNVALVKYIYLTLLKLLHPFIPFATEKIYSYFKNENDKLLIVNDWPKENKKEIDKKSIANFDLIKNFIIKIRETKKENKIDPGKIIPIQILKTDSEQIKLINGHKEIIEKLGRVEMNLVNQPPQQSIEINYQKIKFYLIK